MLEVESWALGFRGLSYSTKISYKLRYIRMGTSTYSISSSL